MARLLLGETFGAAVDGQEAAELLEVQLAVPVLIHHRQRLWDPVTRFNGKMIGK